MDLRHAGSIMRTVPLNGVDAQREASGMELSDVYEGARARFLSLLLFF